MKNLFKVFLLAMVLVTLPTATGNLNVAKAEEVKVSEGGIGKPIYYTRETPFVAGKDIPTGRYQVLLVPTYFYFLGTNEIYYNSSYTLNGKFYPLLNRETVYVTLNHGDTFKPYTNFVLLERF